MIKICDALKFSGKKPKEGIDYIETEDTFTILNVPILAEMTQRYDDGVALKSADEILKVSVNNVPLTIVDFAPTHPQHLENLDTFGKKDVVAGYMSETAFEKKGRSKTKKYSDFILFNTKKIDSLKQIYLNGGFIDTSIGFKFEQDNTPGQFNGIDYDYVQRDIVLDHNAILIDRNGNIGTGRMPSPIGGIGADENKNINIDGGHKMAEDEIKKQLDALTTENSDLKKKIEDMEKVQADLKKAEADAKKAADLEATKDIAELKVKVQDSEKALDEAVKKLAVFEKAEADAFQVKKDAIAKAYPDLKEEIDNLSKEWVSKKFDSMNKNKDSKDIGADMFGKANKQLVKSESERFSKYTKKEVE